MAQNITLLGASYSAVPSVTLPKTGGGTAQFDDTTIASDAAAAGDIASGKKAYVNGSLVTGTASGGGGGTLKVGAIRPDAVADTTWTYDKLIHQDEGVTIPSYSTSEQVLKAASTLVTDKQLDNTAYDYFVTCVGLAAPVYSSTSKGSGRCAYSAYSHAYEIISVPSSSIKIGTATSDRYLSVNSLYNAVGMCVYWRSSSAIRVASSTSSGAYVSMANPSFSSSYSGTPTITINSPRLCVKGSSTYLSSTYWGYMTDIRFQYIVTLWKVPRTGSINGFAITSQIAHAVECAQSENGTLT